MTGLQLVRNDLCDLERTLTAAHVAYAAANAREPDEAMIVRTIALLDRLATSVLEGTFLQMDMAKRVTQAPKALAAINRWLDAAYRPPADANVVPLEGRARKLRNARRHKMPKATRVLFASPSTVASSIGRPAWRDEAAHDEHVRRAAEQNLFQDVRPMFGQDIDQLRSTRKLRVQNAFSSALEMWGEFEHSFDVLLGNVVRFGRYADTLPYGRKLADHVEQMLFECAAAALEGDGELFDAAVGLAETTMYTAILGPVASVEETGVWAAFHLT